MADPVLFELLIPSQMSAGMAVQDRVIGLMQELQFSMRDIFAMRLSLEEGISNGQAGLDSLRVIRVAGACGDPGRG
jgi:hypothetical protein